MQVSILGKGVFGCAIGSLIEANGYSVEYVDLDQSFVIQPEVLFVAVPVQYLRQALATHLDAIKDVRLVVNCSKGIEQGTGYLPHQIVSEVMGSQSYVVVSGPSFASEIVAKIPTTVSVSGTSGEAVKTTESLLKRPYFVLEELGTILELELAGAMKNIYAVATGYVAGSGGGKNTIAHLQVVALREYTTLIHALEGEAQVVRPGVVGDLILTCGSDASRNYQYGLALAEGKHDHTLTAEGVSTAKAILQVAKTSGVSLPLAEATFSLVEETTDAHTALYKAIGF